MAFINAWLIILLSVINSLLMFSSPLIMNLKLQKKLSKSFNLRMKLDIEINLIHFYKEVLGFFFVGGGVIIQVKYVIEVRLFRGLQISFIDKHAVDP